MSALYGAFGSRTGRSNNKKGDLNETQEILGANVESPAKVGGVRQRAMSKP